MYYNCIIVTFTAKSGTGCGLVFGTNMASAGKQAKLNFTATRPRPVIKKETESLNRPITAGHTKTGTAKVTGRD